ncbi:hypothetical protein RRG08_058925 [Elysia crispata]|uniref:Uncharacterized protein n=1 Tax=Elysia crispata TaxID=231223 RepID=A0AAE0XR88_9GAST|nr:hypothetical protein RRG08_058925 [Elysia crispata]
MGRRQRGSFQLFVLCLQSDLALKMEEVIRSMSVEEEDGRSSESSLGTRLESQLCWEILIRSRALLSEE